MLSLGRGGTFVKETQYLGGGAEVGHWYSMGGEGGIGDF